MTGGSGFNEGTEPGSKPTGLSLFPRRLDAPTGPSYDL